VPPRKRGPSDQARATVYQKVGELITGSRPPPGRSHPTAESRRM
jgi:hypothetical protein